MTERDDFGKRGEGIAALAILLLAAACGRPPISAPVTPAAAPVQVVETGVWEVNEPAGAIASRDIIVTDRTIARIMRIAPAGTIAEHHHPHFEEVLFVHAGSVTVALDNVERRLVAGTAVFIPAGTVIAGRNTGSEEAVLLVTWSRVSDGPLTIPGRAH